MNYDKKLLKTANKLRISLEKNEVTHIKEDSQYTNNGDDSVHEIKGS